MAFLGRIDRYLLGAPTVLSKEIVSDSGGEPNCNEPPDYATDDGAH